MDKRVQWLADFDLLGTGNQVDGLVYVRGYSPANRPPDEVAMMERAQAFGAHGVFFEAPQSGRPCVAQAFIFVSDGPAQDVEFAELHKRLWSWGGVPLLYRKIAGQVQLYRCAHKPDFIGADGLLRCNPIRILKLGSAIADLDNQAWWDASRLRNGTIWDDPASCKLMLSAQNSAHKKLISTVKHLNDNLNSEGVLRKHLRRRLLILSLLIAYLEERGAFADGYFARFAQGATRFFHVLSDGEALVDLLIDLEDRFNGHVFSIPDSDRELLQNSTQLKKFARMIEGREEPGGQLSFWKLYSFRDLPVELISHIYQLFVTDNDSSVYTPPFLVRLMLEEALSWDRMDRLHAKDEVIFDPSCGSGVFLVEAYKRLVLHWRSRNGWRQPRTADLKRLLKKVQGADLERGAIELAAFSLCLALCDALEPEDLRSSIRLFPELADKTLHHGCFFEGVETGIFKDQIGVLLGNPPFESKLTTPGAERACAKFEAFYGPLPDKQLAYLFLHEAMSLVAEGGLLSMLQQYNFLYNQQSSEFRRAFFKKWRAKEVLDFVSVRGLFQKGGADTKVIVVVAEASVPDPAKQVLHAVFRRSGRVDAEQGFDIDYYDLIWVPNNLILQNDHIWRANLLGGGRVLAFVNRLKEYRTLRQYALAKGWDFGEGFIEGRRGVSKPADHIIGKNVLPSEALTGDGIDQSAITRMPRKPIEGARSSKRFTPPMLLVREHMDLPHALWNEGYLTYKNKIVGFAAPSNQLKDLRQLKNYMDRESTALKAFAAVISLRLFTQKATTLSAVDILDLPFPEDLALDLSKNEQIIAEDIIEYQRDLIRLGEGSSAMQLDGAAILPQYVETFSAQVNEVKTTKPLKALPAYGWPGSICQPFVFGGGSVEWDGAEELKGRIDKLLKQKPHGSLMVTRLARIYDGNFVFILKSSQRRFWTRTTALRDADETLADLREQGL